MSVSNRWDLATRISAGCTFAPLVGLLAVEQADVRAALCGLALIAFIVCIFSACHLRFPPTENSGADASSADFPSPSLGSGDCNAGDGQCD
ncbi:hypothetical protein ACFONG_04760 [Uliginosibacterium paludis]|uniref:Uncharacterized protein n=1 Tax=Uliginosibacterium paludis TaxID=1615952 RepID=A0ABV2CN53_9RHOO